MTRKLMLGLVLAAAGCSSASEVEKVAVVPASLKLQYQGKPPAGARVVLVPAGDASPDSVKPRGLADKSGVVPLGTYERADGAPPGEYQVSVRWVRQSAAGDDPDEGGPAIAPGGVQPDAFKGRYSNPQASGLKVTVDAAGKVTPAVLELK